MYLSLKINAYSNNRFINYLTLFYVTNYSVSLLMLVKYMILSIIYIYIYILMY